MNRTFLKNKKLLIIGGVFILSLTAFKYISGSAIAKKSQTTQTAGFNTRVDFTPNEPCVAQQFKASISGNYGYKPIKWSTAKGVKNIFGADSVIVHGYRLSDDKGISTIYTKLIYFNTNCEVVFTE